MTRVAVFQPIVTLDLDTKVVTVDWGNSLQHVDYQGGHAVDVIDDEDNAGLMMDDILDFTSSENPVETAIALRNLAAHIDQYTIQEIFEAPGGTA